MARAPRPASQGRCASFWRPASSPRSGGGLTLPFLVIYLHQVRHIPLGISGLLIGGVAVLALPVTPWAGALVDRFGARGVLLVALILEGLGVGVAGDACTAPCRLSRRCSSSVIGQAAGWPTWNALLGVMIDDDTISRLAFARNFQLLNLGLGIGAVIGGLVVHVRDPGTFVAIYLFDGTSNLAVVAALALLPRRAFAPLRRPSALEERRRCAGRRRPGPTRRLQGRPRRRAVPPLRAHDDGPHARRLRGRQHGLCGIRDHRRQGRPGHDRRLVRGQHVVHRAQPAAGASPLRPHAAHERPPGCRRGLRRLVGHPRRRRHVRRVRAPPGRSWSSRRPCSPSGRCCSAPSTARS